VQNRTSFCSVAVRPVRRARRDQPLLLLMHAIVTGTLGPLWYACTYSSSWTLCPGLLDPAPCPLSQGCRDISQRQLGLESAIDVFTNPTLRHPPNAPSVERSSPSGCDMRCEFTLNNMYESKFPIGPRGKGNLSRMVPAAHDPTVVRPPRGEPPIQAGYPARRCATFALGPTHLATFERERHCRRVRLLS